MNKKGVAEIVLIAIFALGALGIMFGPKLVSSFGDIVSGGNKNQSKQSQKFEKKYTIGTLDEHGKFQKLGDYSERNEMQNLIAQQAPEKWSTKVKTLLGLVVVLFVAFPSLAVKAWLKAKSNLKQIVTGVALAKTQMMPNQIKILDASLSRKTDTSTKKAVKKIVPTIPAEELK